MFLSTQQFHCEAQMLHTELEDLVFALLEFHLGWAYSSLGTQILPFWNGHIYSMLLYAGNM